MTRLQDCPAFKELQAQTNALSAQIAALSGAAPDDDSAQINSIASLQAKTESLAVPRLVFFQNPAAQRGFRVRTWGPRPGGDTGDEASFRTRWGGAPVGGIPSHSSGQAHDLEVFETDYRFQANEPGQDEHELVMYVRNTNAFPLTIIDTDPRAESVEVYTGCPKFSELTYSRYQIEGGALNAPFDSGGEAISVIQPGDCTLVTVLIHDPGADFSGLVFEGRDPDGNAVEIEGYSTKPTVSCVFIDYNLCNPQPLAEGQSYKPLTGYSCNGDDGNSGQFPEDGIGGGKVTECAELRLNFFNENQFSWGFNAQNTDPSDEIETPVACIPNADYELDANNLTNNDQFTLVSTDNGNGTFNHEFRFNALPGNNQLPNVQWNGVNFGRNPTSDGIELKC